VTGRKLQKIALLMAVFGLAGCQTVAMPDLSFAKVKGFFKDKDQIDDFPDVADAPPAPTDMRDDTIWDTEAKNLIRLRDEVRAVDDNGVAKTDAQLAQELDALRAKVHAYKADDPIFPQ